MSRIETIQNREADRGELTRVAMVTTHPIQYQVPWLRMLAACPGIDLQVLFAMLPDEVEQGREFGVAFSWDTPLLGGYHHTLLQNRSTDPSLTTFGGCDTPGLAEEIRKGKFDAVIVNGWGTRMAIQALWACRRLGIPCIVRGEVNGLRARGLLKRLAHRALLRQYASFLVIGARNRQYYQSLGVSSDMLFETPYCVDNARFSTAAVAVRSSVSRSDLRRRFGLSDDATTFVFSGKFVEKKRPLDAVDALRKVIQAGVKSQLLMVGDGPLRSALESASRDLPVAFAGFINQSRIAEAYVASDCLILPSDAGETWGLVVNEAMACGLPALVSDQVGCAVDLVIPGQTGDVFACGDVASLARLMVQLGDSPALLSQWGDNACRRVEMHYTFDSVLSGVTGALDYVVAKRGRI